MALPKTRKKKARAPVRRKTGQHTFSFDGWENWDGQKFHRFVQGARQELYQEYKATDLAADIFNWMKDNGYEKKDIASAKKAPGTNHTLAISCKLLNLGMPDFNPKEAEYWESLPGTMGKLRPTTDWVKTKIAEMIQSGSKVVEEKKVEEATKQKVYVPSIQERIRDQSYDIVEDIDTWLEDWIIDPNSFDPKGFDVKRHFTKMSTSQAHARKIKSFYEDALTDYDDLERMPTKGQLAKMSETDADQWEQLKEGYAHIKKADIKKYRAAIEEVRSALDFIIDQAKANRKPRKAKPRSADKVVAKLKFCKADPKYNLASVNPVDVVGANELWVFNVKTRKLGKYVASNIDPKGLARDGTGLSVKGTTIIGFDENASIQKTLRKPVDQLKEFKSAGKVALRKFMDEIKTTDTKLNGRCNLDTILLKVS